MLQTASADASSLDKVTVAYRKIGAHEILADVFRPKGNALRPVIVHIHGGALITGSRDLDPPGLRQWLAEHPDSPYFDLLAFAEEKGFALVSIDYRLAPETKLPDIIDDIEAAFRWIGTEGAKRFRFDPNRMVVVGESAGGYLALVAGYRASPKPKALVALYGYGRLNADWYAKPNPYPNYNSKKFSEEDALKQTDGSVISDGGMRKGDGGTIYMYYRQNGLWPERVSGFPHDSISRLIAPYEPAKNVTRDYPATFMMHGMQDTDVPFEESENMAAQFQAHGVPYLLVPIAKGEHGFVGGDPGQIETGYVSAKEFMVRYLEPN